MNFSKSIIAAAVSVFSALCGTISAQELNRYEVNVGDFNELNVIEGLKVDYVQSADSAGIATFDTTPDMASLLMFTNNKEKLDIQIATDGINYTNLPPITVRSRFLTKVSNSGDSLVRVLSVEPCANFKARLIGNGQIAVHGVDANYVDCSLDTGNGVIAIDGKTQKAKFTLVGTGSIQADDLIADEVKCSLLGTGSIGCHPTTQLTVVGASSGKVFYRGEPKVKNRSIGVKINPIEE